MGNLVKYHLTHSNTGWVLKQEGSGSGPVVGKTKEEAVRQTARLLNGQGCSVRIHKLDGTFEEERTYPRSADPRQSKG